VTNIEKSNSKELESVDEELNTIKLERDWYKNEFFKIQDEIDKIRESMERNAIQPLLIATVSRIVDENSVIIHTPSGNDFLVKKPLKGNITPGTTVGIDQQNLNIVRIIPSNFDAFISGMELVDKPLELYEDIGGLDDEIQKVREVVELPLSNPEYFRDIGIDPPNGILLVGPPGTGKTLLARAVANATNATFIRLVGSELVNKFIGEGAKLVRELFAMAREKAPVILFIDEIDAIASTRTNDEQISNREVQRTLMQLLAEMDGFNPLEKVRIIGATNRPDILDPAIMRPGRFDRIINFKYPDQKGRLEIFKIHTRSMPLENITHTKIVNTWDDQLSGADIKAICIEAGMNAIRKRQKIVKVEDFNRAYDDFIKETRGKKPTAPVYS
jgi:proteasome regulatory subunit